MTEMTLDDQARRDEERRAAFAENRRRQAETNVKPDPERENNSARSRRQRREAALALIAEQIESGELRIRRATPEQMAQWQAERRARSVASLAGTEDA